MGKIYWTPERVAIAVDNAHLGTRKVSEILGINVNSVRRFFVAHKVDYAKFYGIPKAIRPKRYEKRYRVYTESDANFIRENAHKGAEFLSKELGKKKSSILHFAYRNKIKVSASSDDYTTSRVWGADKFMLAKEMADSGVLATHAAKKLGIPYQTVRYWYERWNKNGWKVPVFTNEQVSFIKNNLHMGKTAIAREIGVSRWHLENKISELGLVVNRDSYLKTRDKFMACYKSNNNRALSARMAGVSHTTSYKYERMYKEMNNDV